MSIAGNTTNQALSVVALVLFTLALLVSVASVWPRRYRRYTHNLTRLRDELNKIVACKVWTFRASACCFGAAAVCLVVLLARVLLGIV